MPWPSPKRYVAESLFSIALFSIALICDHTLHTVRQSAEATVSELVGAAAKLNAKDEDIKKDD